MEGSKPLFEAVGVTKSFGGLAALKNLTFVVKPAQIKALIGPNGAGKTTFFNLTTAVYPTDKGEIRYRGICLNGLPTYRIVSLGITRTFQNLQIFKNLSIIENVMVARYPRTHCGILRSLFRTPSMRQEENEIHNKCWKILELVGLEKWAYDSPTVLPFGLQRRLEIVRALATDPQLLLLDEPAAGLNLPEMEILGALVLKIRDQGITVLLIEHAMDLVMKIADEIVVLNYGEKIAEGTPREIQNHPAVIAAYLGEEINA